MFTTTKDPELEAKKLEEIEAEKAKARSKAEKKRRSYDSELTTDFVEEGIEDDDIEDEDFEENEGDIGAIKAKYGKKKAAQRKRSREDEEEAEKRVSTTYM
jgi:hypothetical protein